MVVRQFPRSDRRRHSPRALMEPLDQRTLFDVDLGFAQASIPAAGNTVINGQQIQIKVDFVNLGSSTFKTDFKIGVRMVRYAFMTDNNRLALSYDDAGAFDLASTVWSAQIAANSPVQTATIDATIPDHVTLREGTYAMIIKLDTEGKVVQSQKGNDEGGIVDLQVLATNGLMMLEGTGGNDNISMVRTTVNKHPHMTITLPDRTVDYSLGAVTEMEVDGFDGDDVMVASGALPPLWMNGFDGNDRIVGADNNDTLIGGANKDTLFGGAGNDRLNGNGGNDRLFGEGGADRLYGYDGQDYLDGGSSADRLEGGAGLDTMLGQSGNDKFFAQDSTIDQVFGSSGTDTGTVDANDVLSSVEFTTQ